MRRAAAPLLALVLATSLSGQLLGGAPSRPDPVPQAAFAPIDRDAAHRTRPRPEAPAIVDAHLGDPAPVAPGRPRVAQDEPLARSVAVGAAAPASGTWGVVEGSRAARAYARGRLPAAQYACLDRLWVKESGWRWNAGNRSSGAYGIPQALPGSKMATAGADWRTNPITQVRWGLGYVGGRYGTACAAWAHWLDHGWY